MSSYSEALTSAATGSDIPTRIWQDECAAVEADFFDHFRSLAYRTYPEEPLLQQADPTLLFTNSFIVALKPMIRAGHVCPGERLVMRQACLRTQNLNRHPLDVSLVAYGSRFEMIGGLIGVSHLSELLIELHELFTARYGVGDRLRMKASRTTGFFLEHYAETPWRTITEFDEEPEHYYRWSYGEPELHGRGVTFSLASSEGVCNYDFGNIVELVYHERVVGYEFGFGVETFVCRMHNARNPIAVGLLADYPPQWTDPRFDYVKDLVRVAHTLFGLGVSAGKGGKRQIMRRTCRALACQLDAGMFEECDLVLALKRLGPIDTAGFMKMFRTQHYLLRQQIDTW